MPLKIDMEMPKNSDECKFYDHPGDDTAYCIIDESYHCIISSKRCLDCLLEEIK